MMEKPPKCPNCNQPWPEEYTPTGAGLKSGKDRTGTGSVRVAAPTGARVWLSLLQVARR